MNIAQGRTCPALLISLIALGSLVYLATLAIGPRVSDTRIAEEKLWLDNIYLSQNFGLSLNVDSYLYLIGAKNPRSIFEYQSRLQSRPLMSLIANPLGRLIELAPMPSFPDLPLILKDYIATYLAFLLVNLIILICSYHLYASMVMPVQGSTTSWQSGISAAPTAFLIGTLLIANEVTKAYFFAAHTQMLNILLPLVALYELMNLHTAATTRKTLVLHSLLTGFAVLAYGGAIVVGAAILLARSYHFLASRRGLLRSFAIEVTLILAMLAMPFIGWWSTVTLITGDFYNHEVVYWRQVVWMLDVFDHGLLWLIATLAGNFGYFFASSLHHLLAAVPLVLLLLYFSWPYRGQLKAKFRSDAPIYIGAACIAIGYTAFFSLTGYRVTRLAMPAAVMGVVALGVWAARLETVLTENQRQGFFVSAMGLLTLQAVWMVIKDGPYL